MLFPYNHVKICLTIVFFGVSLPSISLTTSQPLSVIWKNLTHLYPLEGWGRIPQKFPLHMLECVTLYAPPGKNWQMNMLWKRIWFTVTSKVYVLHAIFTINPWHLTFYTTKFQNNCQVPCIKLKFKVDFRYHKKQGTNKEKRWTLYFTIEHIFQMSHESSYF